MPLHIHPACEQDAEQISAVIIASILETNARDYSADLIARLPDNFAPARIRERLFSRDMFVCLADGQLVGTASLDGATVRSVFVKPRLQGRGIGRALMDHIEALAAARGVGSLSVPASVTARQFYQRLGYSTVREVLEGDEPIIVMRKALSATR